MAAFASTNSGFTAEQQRQIIEALNRKIRGCSACGLNSTWRLVTEGIINMPVSPPLPFQAFPPTYYGTFPSQGLPCVGLICTNCGHFQFHSVIQLGLGHVLGVLPTTPLYSS